MRIRFYTIEMDDSASLEFCEIESGRMEPPMESAKATVNQWFQEFITKNPALGQIIVVRYNTGDEPSTVVAVDHPFGQPVRKLTWVVEL